MLKVKPFSKIIPGSFGVALTLGAALWVQAGLAGSSADSAARSDSVSDQEVQAGPTPDRTALASALQDLVSAEYALDVAEQDYLAVRSADTLSDREEQDYKGFLEAPRQSLNQACDRVERLEASITAQRESCRSAQGAGPVSAPRPGQTQAEKVAAIDAELQASVAEFDGLLQREQLELEKTARNSGSQGGGAAGGGGASGAAGDGGGGQGNQGNQGQQSASGGDVSAQTANRQTRAGEEPAEDDASRGAAGPPQSGPGAPIPDDIPEAQDDDIVARQLREAAENETDPELRKRLWDEYKRYKESQG